MNCSNSSNELKLSNGLKSSDNSMNSLNELKLSDRSMNCSNSSNELKLSGESMDYLNSPNESRPPDDSINHSNSSNESKLSDLRKRLEKDYPSKTSKQVIIINPDAYTSYKDGILNFRKNNYNKDNHETQICFVCDKSVIYKNIFRYIASTERKEKLLYKNLCTIYREVNLCGDCSNMLGTCCISTTDHQSTLLSERSLSFFDSLTMTLEISRK